MRQLLVLVVAYGRHGECSSGDFHVQLLPEVDPGTNALPIYCYPVHDCGCWLLIPFINLEITKAMTAIALCIDRILRRQQTA
uniref:Uncharacterized protein n=1 Tax=Arundo donax TaxID=35708 RepID=A0A0A9EDK4_ARUDO